MATSGGLITLRPREFFLYGELAHEMIHITLGISAYIANFGFFSWWSEGYTAGDSMYVANNIVEIFMNLHSMHESRAYLREHEGQLLPYQIGNTKHEFRLNLCYLLGAICFAVGALLFEIPVYEACQDAIPCLAGGTWMFTFGSLFFVVASFANTMGVAVVGTIEMQDYETRLAVLALGFNTAGSAFYLAGSPFYFPQVDGSGQTWGSGDVGTLLYVLGMQRSRVAALSLRCIRPASDDRTLLRRALLLQAAPASCAPRSCASC